METQLVLTSSSLYISLVAMGLLGTAFGILVTRLYDHYRKPDTERASGLYRCRQCWWVFHLAKNGNWSSAIFDEENLPFRGAHLAHYSDEDFRYIYGDCYNNLQPMEGLAWDDTRNPKRATVPCPGNSTTP